MRFALFAAAGFAAILGSAPALAQEGDLPDVSALSPGEIVELRQATMRSNGGTLRGAAGASPEQAIEIGAQMVENATLMFELFPEGSQSNGTLDAIWTDREGFEAQLQGFLDGSEALLAAAEAGDAGGFQAAFQSLGQSCGVCHQAYRNM